MTDAIVTRNFICLANSRKTSGRCIAGLEKGDARYLWIRPVSKRRKGELSEVERRYENGERVQVLDKVKLVVLNPRPIQHQQENIVADPKYYWVKIGSISTDALWRLPRHSEDVLWDNSHKTFHGLNDKVAKENLPASSLTLVKPDSLIVHVRQESQYGGGYKKKVRGEFFYKGVRYILAITDAKAEDYFLGKGEGQYNIKDSLLCVSLGDTYNGFAYKLIATIFTPSMQYV